MILKYLEFATKQRSKWQLGYELFLSTKKMTNKKINNHSILSQNNKQYCQKQDTILLIRVLLI